MIIFGLFLRHQSLIILPSTCDFLDKFFVSGFLGFLCEDPVPHIRRPKLEWALRARPPIHNTYECIGGCYLLWSRSPPLRSMLCTSSTTLSASFICWVQILAAHFTGTQQTHFEALPVSPGSRQHDSPQRRQYLLQATSYAAFPAHELFTRDPLKHSTCAVSQRSNLSVFGEATVTKLAQTHTTLTCTLIPQSCVGPAMHQWSRREKGVRASG